MPVQISKVVQMSIKMEAELRDQFMAVAAVVHHPAAQIIRDLMRAYINKIKTPNALTVETLQKSDNDKEIFHASSATDLFKQLDI